ncbi:MAG: hypothetical protein ACPG4Y_00835 [Chitinophagales bacterium]
MKIFEKLPKEDLQLLLDAPILVTILIGGADGNLDNDEKEWAGKLANIRANADHTFLQDYYEMASENFDERLETIFATFPKDTDERCDMISEILSGLNDIYENLDVNFVTELNKSLRSFAHQVAEASGGILGFGAESYQEHQWVELGMIKE